MFFMWQRQKGHQEKTVLALNWTEFWNIRNIFIIFFSTSVNEEDMQKTNFFSYIYKYKYT